MKFIKGRFKGIDIDRIHRTVSQGKVGTPEMIRILEVGIRFGRFFCRCMILDVGMLLRRVTVIAAGAYKCSQQAGTTHC